MNNKGDIDRVWDIVEKVGVCMLTTQFPGGLRARPLEARPDREAGLIFFVTDVHSAKEDEIAAAPDVGLVFIDPDEKAYLSITGRASVLREGREDQGCLAKNRRGVVARRSEQSGRELAPDRTFHGRIVGRTGERSRHCLRVRQGEADRARAEARPESQDHPRDVSGPPSRPDIMNFL